MKRILMLLSVSLFIVLRFSVAEARYCSYTMPANGGPFWIETMGNQTVNFRYFGGVSHILLWDGTKKKVYDGIPVDSFHASGLLAIEAQAHNGASIEVTTDWSKEMPGCR